MTEGVELPVELDALSEVCTWCMHLDNVVLHSCAAFDVIPVEIWEGENDHTKPYEGDGGIQFAPIEEGGASAKSIKAIDPREEAERRLQKALEVLFANLASDIAEKIAKGEPIPDELLTAAFGSVIEPQLVEAATAEGIRIAAEVGVQFDPAVVNERAADWARRHAGENIRKITDTTQQAVREIIAKYHETPGMTRGEVEQLLRKLPGAPFSTVRAEAITTTEITSSYSAGINDYISELGKQGIKLTREWLTNRDELTCPVCQPLHQKPEKDWADRFPSGPPAHVRCLPGDALVSSSSRITAATKRWYEGDMIFIRTAAGDELAVTPNHPVLTNRGWVAAKFVQPGSYIMRCINTQRMASFVNPNYQYMPARIEELVSARISASDMSIRTMPSTPEDFHGDGGYGNINLITSAEKLRSDINSQSAQHIAQGEFVCTTKGPFLGRYAAYDLFLRQLSTLSRSMGCRDLSIALGKRHLRPFQAFSGGLSSYSDATVKEMSADNASANAKTLCNGVLRQAGLIEPCYVLSVQVKRFGGHVYNLETELGWYITDNIITHNCRCSLRTRSVDGASS